MRIEFNAGQLNGFSIAVFREHSYQFEKSVDTVKDGFDSIRQFIYNMNGGVGILQDAVDLIKDRIRHDEEQKDHIHQVRQKCADYLEEVKQTDHEVARLIRIEKYEFCKQYPHLAPLTKEEKSWLEKALDAIVGGAKKVVEWGKKVVGGVLDWVKEKGKEIYETIVGAVTQAVEWLVEQGKNIYEGIKTVFEFVAETITSLIEAGVDFITNFVKTVLDKLEEFLHFAIHFTFEALKKIVDLAGNIVKFVINNFEHILDTALGALEIIGGIATIILIIGEEGFSLGTATPLAILQLIGAGTAIFKGWDKMWGGIFGMAGYEPEGALKVIFRPADSLEKWLNDLAPDWHLGDIAGFAGNMLTLFGDIVGGGTKVIDIIGYVSKGLSAVGELAYKLSGSKGSEGLFKVWDVINSGFDAKDTLEKLPEAWNKLVRIFT